jgi:ferredoxin
MSDGVIRYTPGDCVLLVGPADLLFKRQDFVRTAGLRPALFCTGPDDAGKVTVGMRALAGRLTDLSGWIGAFRARMHTANGSVDLGPLAHHDDGHFDWVLDFTGQLGAGVPAPGHYRLGEDDFPALKRTLIEIARRVRDGYEKPAYFKLDPDVCGHRRQEIAGCSACLAVCATGAITRDKHSVRIEPHLCQGCGACALVCPGGAVRLAEPDLAASMQQVGDLLTTASPGAPGLWITSNTHAQPGPDDWHLFPVANPAALGIEFWLAALARGYARVAIEPGALPAETRAALAAQADVAQAMLAGLGLPKAIGLIESAAGLDAIASLPETRVGDLVPTGDKRALMAAALDELIQRGVPDHIEFALPSRAPLGTVEVNQHRCTLCGACIRICPSRALTYPGALNRLAFTESLCVQCGLCVQVCPEKAMGLTPRLLVSTAARNSPRVVAEATMFACTDCGKPFATQAMIERSRAMMAEHPAFQGRRGSLMELCVDCRQRAMAGIHQSDP